MGNFRPIYHFNGTLKLRHIPSYRPRNRIDNNHLGRRTVQCEASDEEHRLTDIDILEKCGLSTQDPDKFERESYARIRPPIPACLLQVLDCRADNLLEIKWNEVQDKEMQEDRIERSYNIALRRFLYRKRSPKESTEV